MKLSIYTQLSRIVGIFVISTMILTGCSSSDQEYQDKIAGLENEIAGLEGELRDAETKIEEKEQTLTSNNQEHQDKIVELEKKLSDTETKTEEKEQTLTSSNQEHQDKIAELEKTLSDTEDQLKEKELTIQGFTSSGLEGERQKLNRKEDELDLREKDLVVRENKVNDEQRNLGKADQISQEYEDMKEERKATLADNQWFRMYNNGITVFAVLASIVAMFFYAQYKRLLRIMEKPSPESMKPDLVRSVTVENTGYNAPEIDATDDSE